MSAYLDHAATTPLRPEVLDAMMPYLVESFGNPSGAHAPARFVRSAIEDSRDRVAGALGAQPSEVVFTSGGTESDNLALMGSFAAGDGAIVCSAVEHHAVLRCVEALGGRVVPVDSNGVVDLAALGSALDRSTAVVSVMLVNNETGVIQQLDQVAKIVHKRAPGAVLHTDAVQAAPWLDVATTARAADLISISAHKLGGPQGVGALVVRKGVKLAPLVHGGGQERERRSGTQNVAGIVGLGAALDAAVSGREATCTRVSGLRDRLVDGIVSRVPQSHATAPRANKAPGHAHMRFDGVESESLLVLLDEMGVYASAGASCSSGAMDPSHVLLAMGLSKSQALGSVRLTLGHTTTDHEVDLALKAVPEAVEQLRSRRS